MDIEAARTELTRASNANTPAGPRLGAARQVLLDRGIEWLRIPPGSRCSLDEIVRFAIGAPNSEARRAFAVLLVHALGIPGVLPARGRLAGDIQSFLERALLNPLRRAGYPFDGTPYDKRQALAAFHATIDEHLRPLEPTIPRWIHDGGLRGMD